MNYRHAYHAGNFADVVKHIILSRVMVYMQRKEGGIACLDTHAGLGRYDLKAFEASRTGEANGGIKTFMAAHETAPGPVVSLLEPYVSSVRKVNEGDSLRYYPGSPRIMHALRRNQDRLSLMELHPQDHKTLAKEFAGAHGVKVHHLDGWMGLKSQLPPKEKRGLVLIDPPFESKLEYNAIVWNVNLALKRFSTGTYCIWYPLKADPLLPTFRTAITELGAPAVAVEFSVGPSRDEEGKSVFSGSGMIVINPPYLLEDELRKIFGWLTPAMEVSPGAGRSRIDHLVQ
jgi:23S rRNA (adenine2030-N6)-methyltransferase